MKIRGWVKEKFKNLKFYRIKTWQLFLLLIPLLFIDATLLRLNHIKMTELRDAVIAADEAGDDEKTSKALEELKNYTYNNMVINIVDDNGGQKIMFGTGPFYLEKTYLRAANKALEEAEKNLSSDANPHGNIYQQASDTCRVQATANGWTWSDAGYINCMVTETSKYPAADEIQDKITASLPSTELYRKNYASPVWTPSLAGFAILITILIIVVIFIRIIIWIVLRLSLLFI
ncbi:hypothetical protein IKE72_02185 [Candidatus Saccharibacteria bacterium]|nr:hypothetical protein [Candidatus Saccharibacteria bacterium]